ncbi:MAG: hypothetical protein EA404_00060, partial [Spirochaetaceae bacterium]
RPRCCAGYPELQLLACAASRCLTGSLPLARSARRLICPSAAILLVTGDRILSATTPHSIPLPVPVAQAALLLIVAGLFIHAFQLSWNPLERALRLDRQARREQRRIA